MNDLYPELLKKQYEINSSMNKSLEQLTELNRDMKRALDTINQTLVLNTQELTNQRTYWSKIVWVLIVALIILAGVEKAGQLFGS
jgi:hypothetical protein